MFFFPLVCFVLILISVREPVYDGAAYSGPLRKHRLSLSEDCLDEGTLVVPKHVAGDFVNLLLNGLIHQRGLLYVSLRHFVLYLMHFNAGRNIYHCYLSVYTGSNGR